MYITFKLKDQQPITFENLLNNFTALQENIDYLNIPSDNFFNTHTTKLETYNELQLKEKYNLTRMTNSLKHMNDLALALLKEDMSEHYRTFYIPKATGGMRRIDAPKCELMETLKDFKTNFEHILKVLPHNAAYAYVKGRSTKEALIVHQKNQSRWFLKLDVKDFFPSCTFQFIMQQLSQLFPFEILIKDEETKTALENIIKLCLLNNQLPQGTPMSPLLTNLIMIPIDKTIQETLYNFNKQTFKYTRYADDILISCKYNFSWIEVQNKINDIFQQHNAPFSIKREKTRYGSSAGRNWNLGLMLNKDNQITIGTKRKKRFKAAIFSFLTDLTNGTIWDTLDVQALLGQYSYYHKIEPSYIDYITNKYSEDFGINFKKALTDIIKES